MDFNKEYQELSRRFDELDPELEMTVTDPETGMKGFLVVWNTIKDSGSKLGPIGKGGTRITPSLTLEEIRMLSRIMALKNAAAGFPLGGAKSGLRADPDTEGFETVYRSFVRGLAPVLAENGGKFGGFGFDIGARPIHPIWACNELGTLNCFTGKPLDMGGTDYDKEGIAGLGVAVAAATILEERGEKLQGSTYGVQGIGAMGAAVVRYFSEYGGVLSYLSDPVVEGTFKISSTIHDDLVSSISTHDLDKIKELLKQGGEKIADDSQEVLYSPVDLLFPCAVHEVITDDNIGKVQAKYVVEGANNPCSYSVQESFHKSGVINVPDFIANPGGIIAAFVELSSDITPEENAKTKGKVLEAKELTRNKIADNVREMYQISQQHGVCPTDAGRFLALGRMLG